MSTPPLPRPIRILLVEDNLLTRLGTITLFETQADLRVVGTATNGREALPIYQQHQPDVVVVDLRMPEMGGLALTYALVSASPPARVLVLTHYQGEDDIFQALKNGALGYVSKESPGEQLLAAVRAVAAGQRFLPPDIEARMAERAERPALTPRERDVLLMVFRGLTNRQLAEVLGISPKTAALHVARILEKLGAQSRTEAVAIALERGLLAEES